MVNNHGFLTKNHQKTTKKPQKPIKTNDLPWLIRSSKIKLEKCEVQKSNGNNNELIINN